MTPTTPAPRIPATVITGFLGAGKTTLIANLLTRSGGRRIALIVNEFGDVGVDGELLAACGAPGCGPDDIVELANGCICCTVADDFLPTIERLLARDRPPEHIVVETSGLALPQPLIQAFAWPEVRTRVTVDAVVTLVDGPAAAAGQFAADPHAVAAQRAADPGLDHAAELAELFEDQLAAADLVVISKSDRLGAEALAALEADLAGRVRAGVRLLRSDAAGLPPAVLLGLGLAAEDDLAARAAPHHGAHDHTDDDGDDPREGHGHDHGHDAFESFVLDLPEIAEKSAFEAGLAAAMAAHGLLRLKGFGAVAGRPMRLVVQAVGPRVEARFDRPLAGARATRLVVIGPAGLDRPAIAAALGRAVRGATATAAE